MTAGWCDIQVKRLLLATHGNFRTVLDCAAKAGNIGVWAAVVDIHRREGLLDEVHVHQMQNAPLIACSL